MATSPQFESLPGNVQILRWPHARPILEEEVLGFFRARELRSTRWSNGPDTVYEVHSHTYRKTLFCIEGSLRFHLPDLQRDLLLHPGDRLILPPGIRHGATVGPRGVTCIEAGE